MTETLPVSLTNRTRGLARGSGWRALIALVVLCAATFAPASAHAQQAEAVPYGSGASNEWIAADLLIARPIGLLGLGMGSAFALVTVPLAVIFGYDAIADESMDRCVREPADYVFRRPLGDL